MVVVHLSLSSGVEIAVHTKEAESFDLKQQQNVSEAITLLECSGVSVTKYKELQQRYAIIDESIVWYGSVDFLAFGRKDTDVLRFKNTDVAGELLDVLKGGEEEQLMIAEGAI